MQYFALSLAGLKSGYLWQLVTFQFMHAGWLHLIFNSLAIFFFGRPVETALGRGRFLAVYFSSGIIGGVVQMLFALMFSSFDAPVVGASAGAYGLVAAFAVLHWTERFTLLIYFLPVTLRGKTLLWGSLALAGMASPPQQRRCQCRASGRDLHGLFLCAPDRSRPLAALGIPRAPPRTAGTGRRRQGQKNSGVPPPVQPERFFHR